MEMKLTQAHKLSTLAIIWLLSSPLFLAQANSTPELPNEEITLSANISAIETFCDLCNGSVDLTPVGGQLPYTYNWSTGQTTEDLVDICLGFYEVTVSDATGCTTSTNIFVGNISYWDAILESQADVNEYIDTYSDCPTVPGILRIGTLPANGPSNITDLSGLDFLTAVGGSVLVFQNPNLNALMGLQNITSVGGSIHLNTNNALFNLENFPNVSTVNGDLFIDNHNSLINLIGVNSVTSVEGEIYLANNQNLININALSSLQSVGEKLDIRICTELDDLDGLEQLGNIGGDLILSQNFMLSDISALDHTINIQGNLTILETNLSACDVEPICFMLNNGAGSLIADNLVGCNSANQILQGCSGSDIDVSFAYGLPSCFAGCDGSITVTASGSNPPFTYLWSTGSTSPTLSTICAGFYEVTITDNSGLSAPFSVELLDVLPFDIAVSIVSPACFGSCDGEIVVIAAGGTAPYTYDIPTNLCVGSNEVMITDANGCTTLQNFEMPGTVDFNVTLDNIIDAAGGQNDGAIDVTLDGGTGPFTYTWMMGGVMVADTEDVAGLQPGDYTLTVQDAEGCEQNFGPYTVGGMVSTESLDQTNAVSIFPNPTSAGVTLHFEQNLPHQVQYTLWNAAGIQMTKGWLSPKNSSENYIEMNALGSGIYVLKLGMEETILVRKIVVR